MAPDNEPTLYNLGVAIARVEGKLDGIQQSALSREALLTNRLDESKDDRRDIRVKLDAIDSRQDRLEAWRNKVTGALAILSLGLLATGSVLAARLTGFHP